jgi:intracellular sulfur oxidation DsrE/DsrF family protein
MRKLSLLLFFCTVCLFATAQTPHADSLRNGKRDSTLRALIAADSAKVMKEYTQKEKDDKMEARMIYPFIKGGKGSGILPVENPTEIPDPNIDYKILFEVSSNNPDSVIKEINYGLDEVARIINLHVASGVPAKKIFPVIVVHAGALHALKNNEAFQKKYKIDNPNIQLINDLKKMGATFIVCGQAMQFVDIKKEELLPDIKVSLTAQTVITHYQLKGYVWHPVW